MPELPEVESVRRSLAPLIGRRVASATLITRRIAVAPGDPPGGFSRAPGNPRPKRLGAAALLEGAQIASVERLGKQLAIVADDDRALGAHLGMTGRFRLLDHPPETPEPHTHARWQLKGGGELTFVDPRRFGGLWALGTFDQLKAAKWAELGPDALGVTPRILAEGLRGTRRPIKAALLDQRVLAGLGNIYADEALFLARLRPDRIAGRLTRPALSRLSDAIQAVLTASIESGGSTLPDNMYRDAGDAGGGYQTNWRVYGRAGHPCVVCARPLRSGTIAQRTTVWCAGCQPGDRARRKSISSS